MAVNGSKETDLTANDKPDTSDDIRNNKCGSMIAFYQGFTKV